MRRQSCCIRGTERHVGDEAYKVQATVWPVVSEPAMKKMANSAISRALVRGRPWESFSLSKCPARDIMSC